MGRTTVFRGVFGSALAVVTLAGCAGATPDVATGASNEPATVAPQPTDPPPDTAREPGQTERLLLARQVNNIVVGEGYLDCAGDLASLPEPFSTGPAVWITSGGEDPLVLDSPGLDGSFGITLPFVQLCVKGFSPDSPVEVTVEAGTFRADTTVLPVADDLRGESRTPHTLFLDGAELRISRQEGGIPASGWWQFAPPPDVREAIATAGSISVSATQGDLAFRTEQPVPTPTTPGATLPMVHPIGDVRLHVWGYPEGAVVPIGLYSGGTSGDQSMELVEEIGTVTMRRSRVAEFKVPVGLLQSRPAQFYCILPPVPEGETVPCPQVWPDYPGQVLPGDRGEEVQEWQDILMIASVINNSPQNRDGYYGPLMVEKVTARQGQGGLTPDGVLGPALYATLTGAAPPD